MPAPCISTIMTKKNKKILSLNAPTAADRVNWTFYRYVEVRGGGQSALTKQQQEKLNQFFNC